MKQQTIHIFEVIKDLNKLTSCLQQIINDHDPKNKLTISFDKPGIYLIDGLKLRSNLEFHLAKGVCLKGSGVEAKYHHRLGPFELNKNKTPICALIYAKNCEHIKFSGEGTIDGNYTKFILPNQKTASHLKFYKYPRPMTLYFENCVDTTLEDIEIKQAPFWTIHLVGCVNTVITKIKIHNEMRMPNTDGIDVDRSKNTLIQNCEIITGDDGICLKCTEETAKYGNCENLNVTDCYIESQSSAIKFGSSSFGDFENCKFERLDIRGTNRGLAFQLRDPGSAINIVFKDIKIETQRFTEKWWGSGEPIFITLLPRTENTDLSGQRLENIKFEDIEFVSDNSIFIYTEQAKMLDNIIFANLKATFRDAELEKTTFDLRPCKGKATVQCRFQAIVSNSLNYVARDLKVNFVEKSI